jgi:hypothetical protein
VRLAASVREERDRLVRVVQEAAGALDQLLKADVERFLSFLDATARAKD